MKSRSLAGAITALQVVAAQTLFTTLFVNDVNQGNGTCVRLPWYEKNATNPVTDLISDDIVCGTPEPLCSIVMPCRSQIGDYLLMHNRV
jgi:hypothetical protein